MGDEKAERRGKGMDLAKLIREKWPELLFIAVLAAIIIAIYYFVL